MKRQPKVSFQIEFLFHLSNGEVKVKAEGKEKTRKVALKKPSDTNLVRISLVVWIIFLRLSIFHARARYR